VGGEDDMAMVERVVVRPTTTPRSSTRAILFLDAAKVVLNQGVFRIMWIVALEL